MNITKADFGNWHIEYIPDDGARISTLNYAGQDLLTSLPPSFKAPERFYGEFETRPVYGYDDCFPTVDPCIYPGVGSDCRDHGKLCWQGWQSNKEDNGLVFTTDCLKPDVNFKRILTFEENRLIWRFEVLSLSGERSVFLHVMHALMPLNNIAGLNFPGCAKIIDEIRSEETGLKSSAELGEYLLAFHPGSFVMLLLKEISEGSVGVKFKNGLDLTIGFDNRMFPTLGIWWNNRGYPEGGGLRAECAFEPIPGTCSDLSKSFTDGVYLSVEPGKQLAWEITWTFSV
jgi:hypothetical protein